MLRVLDIVEGTSVDGPGLRLSIYFAGCDHHCPGCHNPESWDFGGGVPMSVERILEVVDDAGLNVTFSGGDPVYQWPELTRLATMIRQRGLTVWCYTGFTIEQLLPRKELHPLLAQIDCLVDGPFIMEQRDIRIPFRGSRNQRLIYNPLEFLHQPNS